MKQKYWYSHNLDHQFWITLIHRAGPYVPPWGITLVRYITVFICFTFIGHGRRALMQNYKQITGKSWFVRLGYSLKVLNNYGKQLVTFTLHDHYSEEFWQQSVKQDAKYYNKLTKALEKGKGVILISAHLGSWELGKHVLAYKDRMVNMVMALAEDSANEDFWDRFRSREGLHIINLKSSPFASVEILEALRRNEIVALHGDRVFNQSYRQVLFFGKEAPFPTGPVELSRISGAPVLGAFIVMESSNVFRVEVDDSLVFDWTQDKEADLLRNVERMARMIETYVRRYPTQWHIFYNFWEKPPALTPPV